MEVAVRLRLLVLLRVKQNETKPTCSVLWRMPVEKLRLIGNGTAACSRWAAVQSTTCVQVHQHLALLLTITVTLNVRAPPNE